MDDRILKKSSTGWVRWFFTFGLVNIALGILSNFLFSSFGRPINSTTITGFISLICFVVAYIAQIRDKKQLEFLKREGNSFDAEILDIIYRPLMGNGRGEVSAKIECVYTNKYGERCLATTRHLRINKNELAENLRGRVYACWSDPELYEVEVFRAKDGEIKFDKNYR